MTKLKISVITINLNNASGLRKTIESVVSQTFNDFEYVVIDGGSTDGSVDVIKEYDDKITYWISEPDKGIYNAMNKGILKAKGEYLLFLNSGDWLVDEMVLQKCKPKLKDYDILYGSLVYISNSKKIINYPEKLTFSYLYKHSLPHPSTFIKKTAFKKAGLYNESARINSDWQFFIKSIFRHNCTYRRIDNKITVFYADGISHKKTSLDIIEKEKSEFMGKNFSPFEIEIIETMLKYEEKILKISEKKVVKILSKFGLFNEIQN